MLILGLGGCSGDKIATYEPVPDPARLYMRLTLDHPALTMATIAPYDTLQLVATPRDANGATIAGLPAPTFTSSDTTLIRVSPEGLLTALQPAAEVQIVAELAGPGNVRHADTAFVNVTSGPQTLATFSIHPTGSDSTRVPLVASEGTLPLLWRFTAFAAGYLQALDVSARVRALDPAQNPISDLIIEYRSLDPDTANIGRWSGNNIAVYRKGRARIVAQTTAYGVTKADTVIYTVTAASLLPINVMANPGAASLFGPTREIRTNGMVMWLNTLDRPVSIVYDAPTNVVPGPAAACNVIPLVLSFIAGYSSPGSYCNGGNITLAAPDSATSRMIYRTVQLQQFSQAGTYTYHDAETGNSGSIVVTDVPSN